MIKIIIELLLKYFKSRLVSILRTFFFKKLFILTLNIGLKKIKNNQ